MSKTVVTSVPTPLFVSEPDAGEPTGGFVLPTGTVTFLMTDIEGSTRAWEHNPGALAMAVPRHYQILDQAITANGGVRPVEQGEGDSVVGAFSRASDAVRAAVMAQRALRAEPWPDDIALAVRMALHTGEAQLRDEGNYFGLTVIRCARLRACGHGGQVLLSGVTAGLVADDLADGSTLVDLGRHRLKDLGRAERVWQLEHPDLRAEFPALLSLDAFRQNLPVQLSPLIGRRTEIAELVALLDHERLVTLTGSAGVGKTRLALAVGAELVDVFPGGVWFVELAGTSGAGSVGRAALKALGMAETPTAPPAGVAAAELDTGGRSLVILDNCEHLITECAEFVDTVLMASADVYILATSREQLGVAGEVAWRVPSLPSPPRGTVLVVQALSQYDAVNLFVDRARRARPSFDVSDDNAASIAQICHRLDGIPFAVELAAARCRHLSTDRIATELEDRFRLLTGGSRIAMPRQQTLAASIEWSYDLLDEVERRVLRRLGVFAGPFPLLAAEAIVADFDDVERVAVFDTISRLVDKSLVQADDPDSASPYRLLETIRAFAIARARDAGELTELRDAHSHWWCEWAEALGATGPTDDVVESVDANHDNLIAALSWIAERDRELGLRLIRPLARALTGTGRAGDAMPAFDTLLVPDVEQQHPRLWLGAATAAAIPVLGFRGGDAFTDLLQRCEFRAAEMDDSYFQAVSGWLLSMTIETDRALLRSAREADEPYLVALAAIRLAIDATLDDPETARDALRDAEIEAAAYPSRYIRDYCRAAIGEQNTVFGDLATTVGIGYELAASPARTMQAWGFRFLATAGLLSRDEASVDAAVAAAEHAVARHVPASERHLADALYLRALLRNQTVETDPGLAEGFDPWLTARDAIERNDRSTAAAISESMRHGGATKQAIAQAITGAFDHNPDQWHEALNLADQYNLRLIAVDALEALGAIAASADSSAEALRLLAAADRLRHETGYTWRFNAEEVRYDSAIRAARNDLADQAEAAWQDGLTLDLSQATAYARRARGERKRPRHGWASLTPTERQVIDLVADGLTNPEIAERLLMARGTVKTHLEHVYAKTGLRNRTELATAATQHKFDPT